MIKRNYLNKTKPLQEAISFFERGDSKFYAGEADLSKIDNSLIDKYIDTTKKEIWYYFNRLIVPKPLRGQGLSKILLQRVVNWADENKVNIWLEINPYGPLNMSQLTELYSRYGFTEVKQGLMIRRIR